MDCYGAMDCYGVMDCYGAKLHDFQMQSRYARAGYLILHTLEHGNKVWLSLATNNMAS